MTFFKWADWYAHAMALANLNKPVVSVTATFCPRCDPTRQAMDYVRHQWIAAGIDRQ